MIQRGEGFRLALATLQPLLAGDKISEMNLQRASPLAGGALGPVHLSDPNRAALLEDTMVAKPLDDQDSPGNGSTLLFSTRDSATRMIQPQP